MFNVCFFWYGLCVLQDLVFWEKNMIGAHTIQAELAETDFAEHSH